ncbi:MAG: murein biosynthesis integral membrane protein MurJ [Myxococcota bacterium]|nr:murein biosynthesis integral membrane protein MurJ [Myxococcota bacterium]
MSAVNEKRTIGIAAVIWGASMLLSRVVGVVREAVVGRVLGSGPEADIYQSAFYLPNFLGYLLAGGAVSMVFIPMYARYLREDDEAGGWRLFSTLATTLGTALAVLIPLFMLAVPALAAVVVPEFQGDKLDSWIRVTRIALPAQAFHVLGGLLSAVLQARDKHMLPAFANLGYAGGIILFGAVLGPSMGPEAFLWGVLVGSILGPFGLPLIGCLREGLKFRPRWDFTHPDLRRYLWLTFPIMLAFSVVFFDDILSGHFASGDDGLIAQLGYGKTLMKVPMGVFGLAVASAAFPTLTRLVSAGKPHQAYETLIHSGRQMLVLAFATQAAFTVAASQVAEVIWGTERFPQPVLDQIGLYTGLYCLGLGGWAANNLLARGFYAQQKTWVPSFLGSAVVLVCYPLYWFLFRELGGNGIAIASSIAITLYTILLAILLRRSMAGADAPALWTLVIRMVPAVLLGIAAGYGIDQVLSLPALLQGAITGSVAMTLTLALGHLFGVPEVRETAGILWGKVARKLGRA